MTLFTAAFNAKVEHADDAIFVNEDKILTFQERDPSKVTLERARSRRIVFECTGIFTSKESVQSPPRQQALRK